MSESKHQKNLIKQYKDDGWLVIRLRDAPTTISQTGTPDLLCLKPNGLGDSQVKFIEVKDTGKTASKLQEYHIKKLREFGFDCEINQKPG